MAAVLAAKTGVSAKNGEVDEVAEKLTRRDVLVGSAAVALGGVATAVLPKTAEAANGDPLILGADNTATQFTHLHADVDNEVLYIENNHTSYSDPTLRVLTAAPESCAIAAEGTAVGLDASAATVGVSGSAGSDAFQGSVGVEGTLGRTANQTGPHAGVLGWVKANGDEAESPSSKGVGVMGFSGVAKSQGPDGCGVRGVGNAIGVRAESAAGRALDVKGKAVFSRSGRTLIGAGRTYKDVSCSSLTTSSMILATLQSSGGSGVAVAYCARLSSTRFRIVLTKAAARNVRVAWFVLS